MCVSEEYQIPSQQRSFFFFFLGIAEYRNLLCGAASLPQKKGDSTVQITAMVVTGIISNETKNTKAEDSDNERKRLTTSNGSQTRSMLVPGLSCISKCVSITMASCFCISANVPQSSHFRKWETGETSLCAHIRQYRGVDGLALQ